ncbi:MAG: glycosyltransferase [Candidatus Pacebacteria bacterium]|nr:glycosyltransferase [Candidatus Paceibacterota bacterium]
MAKAQDKVLMIGWEYPPHNSGGLGVACEGMTRALVGSNTQVYFTLPYNLDSPDHMRVLSCVDPSWEQSDQPPFLAYSSVVKQSVKRLNAAELSSLPHSQLEQKVERYAQLVDQQAARFRSAYDVIHAHDWMSFPAAAKVKKQTGQPMIAHVHSTEFDRIPDSPGSSYIKQTEYQGMHLADQIIAVSFYTKKLLINKYQVPADKISVVHNGVSPWDQAPSQDRLHFAQKRPMIAFMGRLTAQKGGYHFIELAKKILLQMPNCLFVVAGNGDLYHELLIKTAGDQLSASLLFSGFVRDQQKDKLLERADVFVMPSLSEPFGLVALEAAQRHTPVVISKTAGVAEVMPSAVQVDFWDLDQMTKQVLRLLKDQGYGQQIVKNQLQDLQQVTWANSAAKIKKVYRQAFLGS